MLIFIGGLIAIFMGIIIGLCVSEFAFRERANALRQELYEEKYNFNKDCVKRLNNCFNVFGYLNHVEKLTWIEPWPGLDKNGKEIDVHMIFNCDRDGAIARERMAFAQRVYEQTGEWPTTFPNDTVLLQDFVVCHWADVHYD